MTKVMWSLQTMLQSIHLLNGQVDKNECCADCVEYSFQDQYLGRNEMWRLGESLVGQCVYADQEVSFVGAITAKICSIYIDGKTVRFFGQS